MADIYGSHFEFGGKSSRQYDLIIATVESERNDFLNGAKEGVTVYNKASQKLYVVDDDYSKSPISFDIEIITEDDRILKKKECREIEKWLFNHRDFRKLYIDIMDDEESEMYEFINDKRLRSYLNCRLSNPTKLEYNGGVVGYRATVEADSNMFWQDPINSIFLLNNKKNSSVSNITVDVDTDFNEFIYPKVKINLGEIGGDIIITNNTDDSSRLTKFVNLPPFTSIIMKGEINYISNHLYEQFYNRNFIRLLDGENNFTILGNVESIEFEYSARRYL